MLQWIYPHTRSIDHTTRHTHHRAIGRHIPQNHGTSPNAHIFANIQIAEHLSPSSHHHVVTQGGVALAAFLARAPQGHALVNQAIVAHNRRFTNHNAHAVIDKHALPDRCARVNFNPGQQSSNVGNQPRHKG